MNEELKNQLTQFLAKALDVANKGIDTAGEQIPLVLQEIVYWKLYSNLIGFVLGIMLVFIFIKATRSLIANLDKGVEDPLILMPRIIILIITLVPSFPLLLCGLDALKAFVAPRLVILEYLKGLL